jgi:hypothetical protein
MVRGDCHFGPSFGRCRRNQARCNPPTLLQDGRATDVKIVTLRPYPVVLQLLHEGGLRPQFLLESMSPGNDVLHLMLHKTDTRMDSLIMHEACSNIVHTIAPTKKTCISREVSTNRKLLDLA